MEGSIGCVRLWEQLGREGAEGHWTKEQMGGLLLTQQDAAIAIANSESCFVWRLWGYLAAHGIDGLFL